MMSKTMEVTDMTPELLETILSTFHTDNEKELARQIVKLFIDGGCPVKVKQYHQDCMKGTYRILCFIKKSAEAVIINNKGMGRDGVSFQVRIDDRSTLDKLDGFSPNIKEQLLNAGDCGDCSSKCENKKYIFTYQGNTYRKCHFLCSNFTFQNLDENDMKDIINMIANEIKYKRTGVKRT